MKKILFTILSATLLVGNIKNVDAATTKLEYINNYHAAKATTYYAGVNSVDYSLMAYVKVSVGNQSWTKSTTQIRCDKVYAVAEEKTKNSKQLTGAYSEHVVRYRGNVVYSNAKRI